MLRACGLRAAVGFAVRSRVLTNCVHHPLICRLPLADAVRGVASQRRNRAVPQLLALARLQQAGEGASISGRNLPSLSRGRYGRQRQQKTSSAASSPELTAKESDARRGLVACEGGGIFYFWQIGAIIALQDALAMDTVHLSGASAGALTAVLSACGVDLRRSVDLAYQLALDANLFSRPAGLAGVWGPLIRQWLHLLLPLDAADRCRGRVHIFVVQLWPKPLSRPVIADFASRDELIEAVMASVHIPFFLDGKPWSRLRGARCMDGSVFAPRGMVDVTREGKWGAPRCYGPALVIDHNADPAVAARRKAGDWLSLRTLDGLQSMVEEGRAFMAGQIASGALDEFLSGTGEGPAGAMSRRGSAGAEGGAAGGR